MNRSSLASLVAGAALLALSHGAQAQALCLALSSEPIAVDPHCHVLAPNNALAVHIYDFLVDTDAALDDLIGRAHQFTFAMSAVPARK